MTEKSNFTALIRENKTLFIIITVGLFLVELEIFAIAAIKSGRKSRLQVSDTTGTVIYETDGDRLSDFNKYYFEKTFGPFENYKVQLVSKDVPFPFRAWFVAAVGIPVGTVLLFGFVFKAYVTLIQGEKSSRAAPEQRPIEAGPAGGVDHVMLGRESRLQFGDRHAGIRSQHDAAVAREVAQLAGGARTLAERARTLAESGELRLACHLAEMAALAASGQFSLLI